MQPAIQPDPENEPRALARARWGGSRPGAGARPGKQILRDIDRAAALLDLTDSPYQRLAFAGLSVPDLMLVCAKNLMEAKDFRTAARILKQLVGVPLAPAAQPDPDTYVLATDDPPPEAAPRHRHHAHLSDAPPPSHHPAAPATAARAHPPAQTGLDPPD